MSTRPLAPAPTKIKSFGRAGDAGATEHYADPLYYTKTYKERTHDVEYYAKLARRLKGPVLEYGIGNGRVALAIAKAGVHVTGADCRIESNNTSTNDRGVYVTGTGNMVLSNSASGNTTFNYDIVLGNAYGQIVSAMLLSHYGWLGSPRQPVTPMGIVGVIVLVVGVILTRR